MDPCPFPPRFDLVVDPLGNERIAVGREVALVLLNGPIEFSSVLAAHRPWESGTPPCTDGRTMSAVVKDLTRHEDTMERLDPLEDVVKGPLIFEEKVLR